MPLTKGFRTVDTGKAILRDYIDGTIGFEELSDLTHTPAKSLMRQRVAEARIGSALTVDVEVISRQHGVIRLAPTGTVARHRETPDC